MFSSINSQALVLPPGLTDYCRDRAQSAQHPLSLKAGRLVAHLRELAAKHNPDEAWAEPLYDLVRAKNEISVIGGLQAVLNHKFTSGAANPIHALGEVCICEVLSVCGVAFVFYFLLISYVF